MTKRGIIAGGNWIVDRVKIIDSWPEEETLVTIVDQVTGSGGSAYNVLINLAKMGASFTLEGIGCIGSDSDGEHILRDCRDHGIGTRLLKKVQAAPTSYTDVMSTRDTGKRTFFHHRGANALLQATHFDFLGSRSKIFHLGYLLLLDGLEQPDAEYEVAAGRVLAKAKDVGLKTSVDVVSEQSGRYPAVVLPTLPYVDYCFMNDVEAAKTTGVVLRPGGELDVDRVRQAAGSILAAGVKGWAIIHAVEGALAMSPDGSCHWQGAVRMPQSAIKGAAGAGDAFAAGVLLGLHEGQPMPECLVNGVCAGAVCLTDPTTTGGMLALQACLDLGRHLGYRS